MKYCGLTVIDTETVLLVFYVGTSLPNIDENEGIVQYHLNAAPVFNICSALHMAYFGP